MQKINRFHLLFTIIFGIGIFLFFYFVFPHHLHYQEQFQLFLFTKFYFIESCSRPGGFSNYLGRFFTQFFISSGLGALIISFMLIGIQQLVYAITRRFKDTSTGWFLSFLPALFYWYMLCDENTQQGGIVATLLILLFTLLATIPKSNLWRRICIIIMIPVLYYLAGGAVVLAVVLLLGYEWIIIKQNKTALILLSFAAVLIVIVCPFIAKYIIVQYPFYRLAFGVDYIHTTSSSPNRIALLWILILIITIPLTYFPKLTNKRILQMVFPAQAIILILITYIFIWKIALPENAWKEEIMTYDYYSRMKKWDKIIQRANRKSPDIPMTVTCLNLALYKTGQLPEKIFDYFQNGPEGLLLTFQRDFMISTVGGEPYYYLGFVNTAQRFAFEAMEALPDYQKSVRSIKRLVETNLINGYYEVAGKYLYFLENTLYYKKWAKDTRSYLHNEEKINSHPEWGDIRRFQIKEDFLFSKEDKDIMLAMFFQQCRDNRMAYEYLTSITLLSKNIKDFPSYYNLKKDFTYSIIPKSHQEALVYIWGLSHEVLSESMPFQINNSVRLAVESYANIYTRNQNPESLLKQRFSKTFWYYLHFRQINKPNENTPYQY